eukprot:3363168-Rhodomonas_salina.1
MFHPWEIIVLKIIAGMNVLVGIPLGLMGQHWLLFENTPRLMKAGFGKKGSPENARCVPLWNHDRALRTADRTSPLDMR